MSGPGRCSGPSVLAQHLQQAATQAPALLAGGGQPGPLLRGGGPEGEQPIAQGLVVGEQMLLMLQHRVQPLAEELARYEALAVADIEGWLAAAPPRDLSVVCLGREPLEVKRALPA